MNLKPRSVSLGFTSQQFPEGVHVCQIVSGDEEREDALLRFLSSGLQTGERATCFSDKTSAERLAEFLRQEGISYEAAAGSGALSLSKVGEIYFAGGRFDPDRMLEVLARYHDESLASGYAGSRVIGEMSPEVQDCPGGERLLEYESRVSLLLRDRPVTAVCQYDARHFNGAVIMDVLKVHPMMVVRGSVVHNPFYIPPEEFLAC